MDFGDVGVDSVDGDPSLFEDVDPCGTSCRKGRNIRRDRIEVVVVDDVGGISVPNLCSCKERCGRSRDINLVFTWSDACDASCCIQIDVSRSSIDCAQGDITCGEQCEVCVVGAHGTITERDRTTRTKNDRTRSSASQGITDDHGIVCNEGDVAATGRDGTVQDHRAAVKRLQQNVACTVRGNAIAAGRSSFNDDIPIGTLNFDRTVASGG